MNKLFLKCFLSSTALALGFSLAQAMPTQAAMLSLTGELESGDLTSTTYVGEFSFPDPAADFTGSVALDNLEVNFTDNGNFSTFTAADVVSPPPLVQFSDGSLLGLEFAVDNAVLGTTTFSYSFVPGFTSPTEASVFYEVENGVGGSGTVNIIPEPSTILGVLTFLGYCTGFKKSFKKR